MPNMISNYMRTDVLLIEDRLISVRSEHIEKITKEK